MDTTTAPLPPNHHADQPGFSGLRGHVFAVLFSLGRTVDGELAADLTDLQAGEHVVDVGCGSGPALRVARAHGATGTGVDPSAEMLRVARLATRGSVIDHRLGTAEQLPVADASASVLWSLASVHHWADVEAGIAEARRVLRPNGRFLVLERATRAGATGVASHGWTDDQAAAFARMCEQAGFRDVVISRHPAGRRRERGREVLAVLAHR